MKREYFYLLSILFLFSLGQYGVYLEDNRLSELYNDNDTNSFYLDYTVYKKQVAEWRGDQKKRLHPLANLYQGDVFVLEFPENDTVTCIKILADSRWDDSLVSMAISKFKNNEIQRPISLNDFQFFRSHFFQRSYNDTSIISKPSFYEYIGNATNINGLYGNIRDFTPIGDWKISQFEPLGYIFSTFIFLVFIEFLLGIIAPILRLKFEYCKLLIWLITPIVIKIIRFSFVFSEAITITKIFDTYLSLILVIIFIFWILNKRINSNSSFAFREALKYWLIIILSLSVSFITAFIHYSKNGNFRIDASFIDLYLLHPAYIVATANFLNNFRKHYFEIRKIGESVKIAESNEQASQSELSALQSRVNPHFLYNSLNSIAALSETDPAKTKEMALALSDFYKYSTNREDEIWTTIQEEIDMIKKYLEVEKIRFGDKLETKLFVSESVLHYKIPKFLIQPLVENAIKYGYNTKDNQISIMISVLLASKNKQITISVQDSGPDFPEDMDMGHGIRSIQKKLNLTYPDNHYLSFSNKRRTLTQTRERAIYEKNTGQKLIEPEMKIATILLYNPKTHV